MQSEFTELTFAHAFLNEFQTRFKVKTIPEFISQQEENIKGYDVKVPIKGNPFYFQFKIPQLLIRWNAKEYREGFINLPYYRFFLLRTPKLPDLYNQHNRLVFLNNRELNVFYCSPEFSANHELLNHYTNNNLTDNSALFKPVDIGQINDVETHKVIYQAGTEIGFSLSEKKKELPSFKISKILKQQEFKVFDRRYFIDLFNYLSKFPEKLYYPFTIKDESSLMKIIYIIDLILKIDFGVIWTIMVV